MPSMPSSEFSLTSDPVLGDDGEFTLALSAEELSDIVDNKMRVSVFDIPQEVSDGLSDANKAALRHLVKATDILGRVFFKQDHPDNLRARDAFEKAAAGGNELARQAYRLFKSFNGLEGIDMYAQKSRPLKIFSDKSLTPGRGFYPQDITRDELIDYVLAHPEQAAGIFSNNTMVSRDGDRLKAVPYSVAFREEMEAAARELMAAAVMTDHAGLAKYLKWQAQALVNDSDPEAMFNADAAWIDLEDSPLEFTIGRESYDDRLSGDVASDPRVKEMLDTYGIKAKSKDIFCIRAGIVNRQSYAAIAGYREHLDGFGAHMPFKEEYSENAGADRKMNFADVDLAAIAGRYAAVRGGLTVAQNLPNGDKLSVQLGAGNRLVFHRQVRQSGDPDLQKRFLEALIDSSQRGWYDKDADFLFTVGHELCHSLGPANTADGRDKKISLGKWGDILEENKADVASIAMTGYFEDIGKFTPEQARKIYLTWTADELPTKQPAESEAHRVRAIMQLNYFREKGAIEFETGGYLRIHPDRIAATARQMLADVIRLQLDGNIKAADDFCLKYAAWNDDLQYIADRRMSLKPRLYREIQQPFMERYLQPEIS